MLMTQFTNCVSAWRLGGDLHRAGYCGVVTVLHFCAVRIANRYGMEGPGIEFRWGQEFSARVQTGTGAHTTTYIMGTGFLSLG